MPEAFFNISELPATPPDHGMVRRAANAEQAMLTFFSFAPGAEVPVHSHPHDQLSVVVRGRAVFEVAGETMLLGPGQGARMPGGVPHGVRILEEETEIWDAWAPRREEYLDTANAACQAAVGK